MNNLKPFRLACGMKQSEVALALQSADSRIDVGMVSRYEQSVCLPTLAQLVILERLFSAHRTELFDDAELDLLGKKRRKQDKRSAKYYRKCFRALRSLVDLMPDDVLPACGYTSWQQWFDQQLWCLINQYKNTKKGQRYGT